MSEGGVDPGRWERIKTLVGEALERKPAERGRFLDGACGRDPELRDEVESLLRQEDDSFLETSPAPDLHGPPTANLSGRRLSHYQVLDEISRGGMGIVYRARDTRLGRDVAIKALRQDLAFSGDRLRRFEREARSASALNHAHIVHIYDIGDHDGTPYIAMEYVSGQTLRDLLGEGPLPTDRALALAIQLVRGLVKAHAAGIVHRDLKPENLMVTGEDQLKILDFGLAKLVLDPVSDQSSGASRSRSETQEGVILGTARYMSPEQARARGSVDFRSDQFAFGSILYEMLTGMPAFARESAAQTMAAIIESEPEPLRKLNRQVPAGIEAVVRRCLEKDPARRYESTAALLQNLTAVTEGDVSTPRRRVLAWATAAMLTVVTALGLGLEWWGGPTPLAERPLAIASLAVLPFEDPSGDPDRQYFADGMTEALITSLARVGALRVMSRNASLHYKETEMTLPEIGRELDVDALLVGSTTLEGDRVRLTAQLVHARTQTALWAESYEADLEDVLALQADVARGVAREIQVQLAPDEEARLATARAVQPDAYEDYLRGVFYLNQFTPEGFEKGLRHLHAAVGSDPADPLAWAGLALGYNLLGHGPDPPPDAFARARAAAQRALSLDDSLADVHLALAEVALYSDWDWPAAEDRLERALAANPNLAEAHYHNAWYQLLWGRNDQAIAEMERATRLDPFVPKYAAWLGSLYWTVGRHDEAIETARRSLEVSPGFPIAWYVIGLAHAARGEYEEAIAAHRKAAEHPQWRWPLANTYALAGRTEEARALLAELTRSPTGYDTWGLAEIHATLGERDEAFRWLETCVETRLSVIPWINWYPNFASLRDDPRFRELERRMKVG